MANKIPKKLKYKPPRWMTDGDYPERGEDIARDMVGHHFWERWMGHEEELAETYVLERAIAEAHFESVENLADLEQAAHQATMYVIYTISEKEWHRFAEYEDVILFLQDKLKGYEERAEERKASDLPGSFYEVKSLIDIVKYLEKLGMPKQNVLGIRHNLSKAKTAQQEMRRIQLSDIPDKKKKESLLEVLDDVVDPEVTVVEYRSRNRERSLKQTKAHPSMNAEIYMVQSMELVVIESPNQGSTRAIEYSLNGMVDGWGIRDGASLIKYLTEKVYTKNKFRRARIVYTDTNKPEFKWGDGGYPMPVPTHLRVVIMEQLGANMRLVDQILDTGEVCWLPLYNMAHGVRQPDVKTWITKNFVFRVREKRTPYQTLKLAIESMYELPKDLDLFEKNAVWKIQMTYFNRRLDIDLRIERSV